MARLKKKGDHCCRASRVFEFEGLNQGNLWFWYLWSLPADVFVQTTVFIVLKQMTCPVFSQEHWAKAAIREHGPTSLPLCLTTTGKRWRRVQKKPLNLINDIIRLNKLGRGGGVMGQTKGVFKGVGVNEMSKRYIVRSSLCLSTHDNEAGQPALLKAASVVSGCCNDDDRFPETCAHSFPCIYFSVCQFYLD